MHIKSTILSPVPHMAIAMVIVFCNETPENHSEFNNFSCSCVETWSLNREGRGSPQLFGHDLTPASPSPTIALHLMHKLPHQFSDSTTNLSWKFLTSIMKHVKQWLFMQKCPRANII